MSCLISDKAAAPFCLRVPAVHDETSQISVCKSAGITRDAGASVPQVSCTFPCIRHAPLPGTEEKSSVQAEAVQIPQRLNNTPMLRGHRKFFYDDACAAVKKAVQGKERLMSVK